MDEAVSEKNPLIPLQIDTKNCWMPLQTDCQLVPKNPRKTSSVFRRVVRVTERIERMPCQIPEKILFADSHAPRQFPEKMLEKTSSRPTIESSTTPRIVEIF